MKILFGILIALTIDSCGSGDSGYGDSKPSPKDSEKFVAIKPLIAKTCGKCHGVTQKAFDSEARWKSSKAKARIIDGSMPQGSTLDPKDKEALLASFN